MNKKLVIGEEVVFRTPDGYPDRGRFVRMEGDHYIIRHRNGDYIVPPESMIDVVRPKPVAYAEVPVIPASSPR